MGIFLWRDNNSYIKRQEKVKNMSIVLIKNGIKKRVATGFSWKSLLFGCLYAIARGDIKGFILQLGLAIITFGLNWFITPFIYNKRFIKRLIEDGYKPFDDNAKDYLIRKFKYQP